MLKWIVAFIVGAFVLKSCAAKLNEPQIGIAEKFNHASREDRLKHPDLYANTREGKKDLPVYLVNVFYRDDKCWLTSDGYKIKVGLMTPFGKILSLRDDYALAKDPVNNVKNYLIYDWRFLSVGSGAASAPEKASQNEPLKLKYKSENPKDVSPFPVDISHPQKPVLKSTSDSSLLSSGFQGD